MARLLGRTITIAAILAASSACSTSAGSVDASGDTRSDAAALDAEAREDAASDAALLGEDARADAAEGPDAEGIDTGAGTADAGTALPDAAPLDADVPDAGPTNPLAGAGTVTRIAQGFRFTEGPAWVPSLGQLLFTDLQTNTIHALTPPMTVAPWRNPSGTANGLAVDADGLVLAAEHQGRRVTRTLANGDIVSVADAWQGNALNSPNDLVVRRSDGTIYFSDPPWGLNGRPREIPFNGLFRVSPTGVVTAERQYSTTVNPNGVAISPDGLRVYVALDTDSKVVVFDVAADGSLSNERDFVTTSATPDGLAMDADGNVYASTSAGIEVFAPDGTRWGVIAVPQAPANCAFGGPNGTTLYITARTALFAVELGVRGAD